MQLCLDCTLLCMDGFSLFRISRQSGMKGSCFCLQGQCHICILNINMHKKYSAYHQDDLSGKKTMSLSQNAPSSRGCLLSKNPFVISCDSYCSISAIPAPSKIHLPKCSNSRENSVSTT